MTRTLRSAIAVALSGLLAAGCNLGAPTKAPPKKLDPKATSSPQVSASAYGRVLGLEGDPAVGIEVRATLVSNNGSGLVSNNGSGVISDGGSNLVGDKGTGLIGSNAANYRTLATDGLIARTDAKGEFSLSLPPGGKYNLEAVKADDIKALRQGLTSTDRDVELKLAYTGNIKGRVAAPKDRQITDYTGVDVFIPGTSYLAKTDMAGQFTLSNVPEGSYTLVAGKTGLGSGRSGVVAVTGKATTNAPDIALALDPLALASVVPANGAKGTEVTLTGDHFGASTGLTYHVRVGGITVEGAKRVDDKHITFTVPGELRSGDVIVEVNGLSSNAMPFQTIESFTVSVPKGDFKVGEPVQVSVHAVDPAGAKVEAPALTWSSSPAGPIAVSPTGQITSTAAGQATVSVQSGELAAQLAVKATVGGSTTSVGGAVSELVHSMTGIALDSKANRLYLSSMGRVITFDIGTGAVNLLAGDESEEADEGSDSIDGQGSAARFWSITSLALGPDGLLYALESDTIRSITTSGLVTTVAGSHDIDGGGDNDRDGTGDMAVLLATGDAAFDSKGNLVFVGLDNLRELTPDHVVKTLTDTNGDIESDAVITFDASDNLYIFGGNGFRKRTPAGATESLDDTGSAYRAFGAFPDSEVTEEPDPDAEYPEDGYPEDGGLGLGILGGLARDASGSAYLASDSHVALLGVGGAYTLIAGNTDTSLVDGPGTTARFSQAGRVALAPDGTLYVIDGDTVRAVKLTDPAHTVTTVLRGAGNLRTVKATVKKASP